MKPKYISSISNENLVSELKCALSIKIHTEFWRLYKKRMWNILKYWLHVEILIFWLYWVKAYYYINFTCGFWCFYFLNVATKKLQYYIYGSHYIFNDVLVYKPD